MDNHIAIIHDNPAVSGVPLFFGFLFELLANIVDGTAGERVEHSVAGAGTNDEIIGEGGYAFQVEQDNVFPFFVFKGVDDFAGKIKCIQSSPHRGHLSGWRVMV